MRDDNCIFCKIANGEIPSRTLYEDEEFRVIMDLGPATRGHALILPKEHYANLFEIPADTAARAMQVAKKVGTQIVEKLGANGLNVVQNNGECAGQTVPHFHIHLIPRYQDDGQHILWKPGKLSDEEMDAIRDQILADQES
ncbi:histidine triad (HIT) family protein [Lachnospiraceae bacterium NK3A20]|jgi:histidine triad (HIT) family protein|nr:histidine triad (HIT) family protein [Lachnospiraceae bacterium NK3A20]